VVNQLGCGILPSTLAVLVMADLPFKYRCHGTGKFAFMTAWWPVQHLCAQLATLDSMGRKQMHEIKKSLTLFACAALPLLAWATPQETTIRGDVPVPHSASPAKPELSAGAKIFDKWCSDCHSTTEGPGSLALQRKYQGALPAVLEQRGGLTPDYIRLAVRHGISFMPSFRKTEISDADLALLAAYLVRPQ
jgi:mono/diheme cytochrome c family protein